MFVWFSELRTVDCGLRTALVGVNVVGEYCSVPGLIFLRVLVFQVLHVVFGVLGLGSFRFLESSFSRSSFSRSLVFGLRFLDTLCEHPSRKMTSRHVFKKWLESSKRKRSCFNFVRGQQSCHLSLFVISTKKIKNIL